MAKLSREPPERFPIRKSRRQEEDFLRWPDETNVEPLRRGVLSLPGK